MEEGEEEEEMEEGEEEEMEEANEKEVLGRRVQSEDGGEWSEGCGR